MENEWLMGFLVGACAPERNVSSSSSDDAVRHKYWIGKGEQCQTLCFDALIHFLGVGAKRVRKVLAAIDNGGITFVDRRTFNTSCAKRSSDASGGPSQIVDAFLNWVYEHLAELLAEATPSDDNPYLARGVEWQMTPCLPMKLKRKTLLNFVLQSMG